FAANEAIHEVLVAGGAELDNDIVDAGAESGIANQRKPKAVSFDVTVRAFAKTHESMATKRVHNAAYRFHRSSRLLRRRYSHPGENEHHGCKSHRSSSVLRRMRHTV